MTEDCRLRTDDWWTRTGLREKGRRRDARIYRPRGLIRPRFDSERAASSFLPIARPPPGRRKRSPRFHLRSTDPMNVLPDAVFLIGPGF